MFGQMLVNLLLQELVLLVDKTLGQMWGDFLHVQELVVDPHVGYVQVNLLRDVGEPMALLRGVEEPRGFLDREDPNGAPP